MINTTKLEHYLDNIGMEAKDQIIRFLMDARNYEENFIIITNQVEEFSRMYPEYEREEEEQEVGEIVNILDSMEKKDGGMSTDDEWKPPEGDD